MPADATLWYKKKFYNKAPVRYSIDLPASIMTTRTYFYRQSFTNLTSTAASMNYAKERGLTVSETREISRGLEASVTLSGSSPIGISAEVSLSASVTETNTLSREVTASTTFATEGKVAPNKKDIVYQMAYHVLVEFAEDDILTEFRNGRLGTCERCIRPTELPGAKHVFPKHWTITYVRPPYEDLAWYDTQYFVTTKVKTKEDVKKMMTSILPRGSFRPITRYGMTYYQMQKTMPQKHVVLVEVP